MPQCTSTEQLLLQSTHYNIVEDLLFPINIQYLSFPIAFMLMFSTASASHSSNSEPHAMEWSRIYAQKRNQNVTEHTPIRAGLKWHHLNFGRSYISIFLPMWHEMYHYWVFYTYPHYIPHLNAGKHVFSQTAWHLVPFCSIFCGIWAKTSRFPTGDSSGWASWEYVKPPCASTYFSVIGLHVFTFIVTLQREKKICVTQRIVPRAALHPAYPHLPLT